jgi:hypothetical protein
MMSRQRSPVSPRPLRTLGFVDRVMAQVAEEPQPTATRVFLRSVAGLRFRDAAAALATAGHLAFGRAAGVPALVRAQSLVLLLVLGVVVGSGGTLAAAGAIRVIEDRHVPAPVERPLVLPQVSPRPAPDVSPSPDAPPSRKPDRGSVEDPTPSARNANESRQVGSTGEQSREGEPTNDQGRAGERRPRGSGDEVGQPDGDRSGAPTNDRAGDRGGTTPVPTEPPAGGGDASEGRHKTALPDGEQEVSSKP